MFRSDWLTAIAAGLTLLEIVLVRIVVLPLIDPSGVGDVAQIIGASVVVWGFILYALNKLMVRKIADMIKNRG